MSDDVPDYLETQSSQGSDSESIPEDSPTCRSHSTALDRWSNLSEPFQPHSFIFPERKYKTQKQAFNASWFERYPWLHYDIATNSAFCFTRIKAERIGALSSTKADIAFTKKWVE